MQAMRQNMMAYGPTPGPEPPLMSPAPAANEWHYLQWIFLVKKKKWRLLCIWGQMSVNYSSVCILEEIFSPFVFIVIAFVENANYLVSFDENFNAISLRRYLCKRLCLNRSFVGRLRTCYGKYWKKIWRIFSFYQNVEEHEIEFS